MADADAVHRDVVVIGTSAGGVEALPRLLAQLPATLPAAVLIVQHLMAGGGSGLVDILARASTMPVAWAEHGVPIRAGRVYVAPAGVHMMVEDGTIALVGGPRENHARPAINRLFRSAAAAHGPRVIGVILTGMLDDGAAGLAMIKDAGGVAIVQDPDDAACSDMPIAAIAAASPDRVLPLDEIGGAVILSIRQPVSDRPAPRAVFFEQQLDGTAFARPEEMGALGPQTEISCPECGGPLWEIGDTTARGYRCYLGHSISPATMLQLKGTEVEMSLWAAVRALQERAGTLNRLAADSRRRGADLAAVEYESRAREAHEHADKARRFLLDLQRVIRD